MHLNKWAARTAVVGAAIFGASLIAVPAANAMEAQASCPSGSICLYTGVNYTGQTEDFAKCEYVDLTGNGWANNIRSYQNNQVDGVTTTFYTSTPLGRQVVATSTAPQNNAQFAQGALVDGMQVC